MKSEIIVKNQESPSHKAKAEIVKKIAEKIKKANTLMIVSIKNLPSKQFQNIKKSLRGKALVIVAKKNIMNRVIKEIGKESVFPLERYIRENSAFMISDIEGFELAGILSKEKTPVPAKAGQIALDDIEVKAGPTSLVAGPAISELGALGIQISIDEGKILIRAPKVVVKKGSEVSEGAASILQKLEIYPFEVGLEPLAVYDVQSNKIYSNIKVNTKEIIEELKIAIDKALGFAKKIAYYCKDTIGFLLAKANVEGENLSKLYKRVEHDSKPEGVDKSKNGKVSDEEVDKQTATEISPE